MVISPPEYNVNLTTMMRLIQVCLCAAVIFGGAASAIMGEELPKGALENLSSDNFELRTSAYADLEKWSKENVKTSPELLHKVWSESEDPEFKTRCYELMTQAALVRKFGKGQGFVGILMDSMLRVPMLKMGVKPKVPAKRGIRIAEVIAKTPGQKAGLKAGDIIVGVDDLDFNKLPKNKQKVDSRTLFQVYVGAKHAEDVITLYLTRDGKKIDKKVTLMKLPASLAANSLGGRRAADKKRAEQDAFLEKWLSEAGEEVR